MMRLPKVLQIIVGVIFVAASVAIHYAESVNLHDYYRGRDLLNFYAELCGVPSESRPARVAELLKLLQLEDAAEKSVAKYSKGMAQRLVAKIYSFGWRPAGFGQHQAHGRIAAGGDHALNQHQPPKPAL